MRSATNFARVRRVLWFGIVVVPLFLGVVWLARNAVTMPAPFKAVQTGKALIRSDFELTTHKGVRLTDEDLRGRWQLVFFGFTYCPEVCPTTLSTMARVIDLLGSSADRVAFLFITVDPERDTVKKLREYVGAFHPKLTGLTGSAEQIKAAAKAFRIYYSRVDVKNAPDGYVMNHSGYIYLMDSNGEYRHVFMENRDKPDGIAEYVLRAIKQ